MPVRLSVLAVVVGLAVAAAPASASTLTGRVSGAKLPKAGKGFTTVRAVHAKTLVIVDVAKVRAHRYRLRVPAGSYWMFAATTPLRGKAGIDRPSSRVAVRKGKRKAVPVSMRKRRRPKAHAAFVNVKHPAVWVKHFAVPGGAEHRAASRGIANMLITDLGGPLDAACGGVLVEREQLGFLLAEQLIGNPGKPPSTDRMIAHNREVGGSLAVNGATTTLTVNVENVVTGTTRSVTRSAATDRFFELASSVVQEVVRLICGGSPPRHYSGPVSGSISVKDGPDFDTFSWSGNVRLKYTGDLEPENGGEPPGKYAIYEPESGSVHVTVDGVSADGQCPYHGEADVTIVPAPGEQQSRVQQGVDQPTYSLFAAYPTGTPPMPVMGPAICAGAFTTPHPLADLLFMSTLTSRVSSSTTLVEDSTVVNGPGTTKEAWSLAPEA